ncbi:hypothetical protein O181_043039 [Austropuccinia psidii MF-1]|uniref:Uncharacterized protein n=1 Tax=Austropuccinia psidii MF-1 TaxID=1389203 RepID=A0A9Q3DHI7_9BASI|nr:hypothetical protein [Austropuccinia psidii MF-1]
MSQYKQYYTVLQRQGLGNFTPNPPSSDELLENTQEIPSGGENSEILRLMESTIIRKSDQKDKEMAQKKREESKEEAPVASTRKPQANQSPQKGKKNKKETGGNHIHPITGSKNPKRCYGQFF